MAEPYEGADLEQVTRLVQRARACLNVPTAVVELLERLLATTVMLFGEREARVATERLLLAEVRDMREAMELSNRARSDAAMEDGNERAP